MCSAVERLKAAILEISLAWSQSWIGYQAKLYLSGFRPRNHGENFDPQWGLQQFDPYDRLPPWRQYSYHEVTAVIMDRAGMTDTAEIDAASRHAQEIFEQAREELLPYLDALLALRDDARLREIRAEVASLPSGKARASIVEAQRPRNVMTNDHQALAQFLQGCEAPPHLAFEGWLFSALSRGVQAAALAKLARQTERYLRTDRKLGGQAVPQKRQIIFIGHGRSSAWRDLKDFLQDRLNLIPDEYNRESAAGIPTSVRLEEMLDKAGFAFLVLTAEDEHADGTQHARENVVHEAGLFQGRLGFRKAILLLEEGCAEFSNIAGLGQIRFPKGNIGAKKDEIRHVLEREGILPAP